LFICGGAFEGIDKIIKNRIGKKSIGFGAEIHSGEDEKNIGDILSKLMPEDLLKYGMIPEFVGRMPIVVTLDALDEAALIRILKEPKNALIKQYQKLFEMDNTQLEFTDDALAVIAQEAIKRKTGARGLRSILEEIMLDIMYEIPRRNDIAKCVVTKEVILNHEDPIIVTSDRKKGKKKEVTA